MIALVHSNAGIALFALVIAACAACAASPKRLAPAPQTVTVFIRQMPPPRITLRDGDGDGVPDIEDDCPEVFGAKDNRGCPAEAPADTEAEKLAEAAKLVEMRADHIEVKQPLQFKQNRAVLLADSLPLLQEVALALKQAKAVRVRVEGHTDRVGERDENLKLSQARAQAVREYLVEQGVEAARLSAEGFGWSRPIASNVTREGRSQNRRVEFRIVQ
ncbi:MAG TPA: OmpA family protein [Myxococcales bacterium]|jgi:outer membrane protein OmpA-like peptidoglycan-associated protein